MPGRSSSAELIVRAMTAAGVLAEVPVGRRGEPLAATAEVAPLEGIDGWSIELVVTATTPEPLDAGIVVALPLGPTDDPRWLIPGLCTPARRRSRRRSFGPTGTIAGDRRVADRVATPTARPSR